MPLLEIRRESLQAAAARSLIDALNSELLARYPEEGATHFRLDADEVGVGRGAFLIAYRGGEAIGCGAVRRLDDGVVEVKRMYVVPAARGGGVGAALLAALETEARALGVTRLVLETGERQPEALALYRRAGFTTIPRFGEYVDSALSLCLAKSLPAAAVSDVIPTVGFADACRYWCVLGFVNFGGPTGQIAMMHRDLVDRRRWISEERFLHALNYCVLLPGPEAQQLAIYIGWLLHGTAGGLVAGIGFVLPSVFILLGLSYVYVTWGSVPLVAALFYGLKPAVVAVVLEAVIRIGKRALTTRFLIAIAAASFLGNAVLGLPFPLLVVGAALLGFAAGRVRPALVGLAPGATLATLAAAPPVGDASWRRAVTVVAVGGVLWVLPIVALALWRGPESVFVHEALFFSRAAMVTFGGAYAVLGYIRDVAVEHYGWLSAGQMMDGLGLAETTPGPLIMVTQFVGFLGAWHHPEGLPPGLAGVLGGLITTWVTFVPCFIWIFLGAPYIERLRGNRHLTAALSAVTAAVVGVILNLGVVFALHTFVPTGRLDLFAMTVAIAAFVALQRWHLSMPLVIAICAGLGALARLSGFTLP